MTEQMTPMQQTKNHFDIFANLKIKDSKSSLEQTMLDFVK